MPVDALAPTTTTVVAPESTSIEIGGYILRFESEPDPGDFYKEKAERELRETEEMRHRSMAELKKLLAGEKDMDPPFEIETYMMAFLRSSKFYPESAFKKMCNMYQFRYKNPKFGANLIPIQEKNVFSHNILTALPLRDQHGRRILVAELGKKWNVKEVSLTEIIRGIMLLVDAAMMEPRTQISGAIVILDFEGLTMQHVWQFSPHLAKSCLDWVQECLPCRLKAAHMVNQPYLFNMLFAIFKPFTNEKLRNRIYFHGTDRASLMQHIDAKFLPVKYGGEMNIDTNYGAELLDMLCQYSNVYEIGARCGYWKKDNDSSK